MFEDLEERQHINIKTVEVINSITFNSDCSCLALATNKGFKIFSIQPLKIKQERDLGVPLQFVEMLDRTNILALVGFNHSAFTSTRVSLFDDKLNSIVADTNFTHNVLAVKLRLEKMVVATKSCVFLLNLEHLEIQHTFPTLTFAQDEPYNIISISNNPFNFILVCPTLNTGYMTIVNLEEERQRRVKAHTLNISYIKITVKGDKVATTSEEGINVKVFQTKTGSLLQEVRRGNQYAQIYSISFSRHGNWFSCTSDSNIVHVFSCKISSQQRQEGSFQQQQQPINPKSKLYFLRKIFPFYNAEYSYCQYEMPDYEPDLQSFSTFGFYDDNLIVINDYGCFRRIPCIKGLITKPLESKELLQLKLSSQR